MKKLLYRFIVLATLLFGVLNIASAGKNCTADFTYTIDHEISSLTYQFTDISNIGSPISDWHWDFGDGSFSDYQNPEHQYLTEGPNIVSLTIVCNDGSTSFKLDTIIVKNIAPPSCSAYFTAIQDTSLTPFSIQFTDHSYSPGDTITSWLWSFGDGSYASTVHPTHQYLNSGAYMVSLTISTSGGCSSTFTDSVYANSMLPDCNAYFSYSADSVSGNQTLMFFYDQSTIADPIVSWLWDFNDGDSSTVQNPTHLFPIVGIYDVTLSIVTQSGCQSTIHYPIQVGSPQKYNLWGRVYLGNITTDKCIAYLYKELNNDYIIPIDTVRLTSVNDTLGIYYFYQMLEGSHKVKIVLPQNSNYDDKYAPTYYGNSLFWNLSTNINLNSDIALANIHLKPIVQQVGNCVLKGSIWMNGAQVPKEGIQVMLLDASNHVYAYTFSDLSGNYEFIDLPMGNFHVHAEVTGLYSVPANINFASLNDTINNVNIHLSKNVANVSICPELKPINKLSFHVYPNPVINDLNLRIENPDQGKSIYLVYNNLGQLVTEGDFSNSVNTHSINVNELTNGFYVLHILNLEGNLISNHKFIKK